MTPARRRLPSLLCLLLAVVAPTAARAATDAQLAAVAALIQKGDLASARAALDGLLALEPDNATLKSLRAQLDAAPSPAASPPPAAPASKPAVASTGSDLPRLDRLELQTIQSLLADAKTRDDFETVARRTDGLLTKYPDYYALWLLRAGTAAALDDKDSGIRATQSLLALGILDRTDAQSEQVFLAINRKDWIAEARAQREKQDRRDAFRRRLEAGKSPESFTMIGSGLSVVFKLVPIEPGTFQMGSETGASDAKPVHTVTLTRRFWLGETEVTQELYQAVTGKNPVPTWAKREPRYPVTMVSYDDALAFCESLTDSYSHILPPGWRFTLPTEAQWEYACRAGTTGDYAGDLTELGWYSRKVWTSELVKAEASHLSRADRKALVGQVHYVYSTNDNLLLMPVAGKQPNSWGLYDMHGNAWEWCLDWYGRYKDGDAVDPMGPQSGPIRIHRGGNYSRSATRRGYEQTPGVGTDIGFRITLVSSK